MTTPLHYSVLLHDKSFPFKICTKNYTFSVQLNNSLTLIRLHFGGSEFHIARLHSTLPQQAVILAPKIILKQNTNKYQPLMDWSILVSLSSLLTYTIKTLDKYSKDLV